MTRWIVSSKRSKLLEKLLDQNQFCGRKGCTVVVVLRVKFSLFRQAHIDIVFRRLPVRPADREFSHIVFRHNDVVPAVKHLAMKFGSIATPLAKCRCAPVVYESGPSCGYHEHVPCCRRTHQDDCAQISPPTNAKVLGQLFQCRTSAEPGERLSMPCIQPPGTEFAAASFTSLTFCVPRLQVDPGSSGQ